MYFLILLTSNFSKLPSILDHIVRFLSSDQKYSISLNIITKASQPHVLGANISYIVSSIESLLRTIPDYWPRIRADYLSTMYRIGYEVQSPFLVEVIESLISHSETLVQSCIPQFLSCDPVWSSDVLTDFEVKILNGIITRSVDLTEKLIQKLSNCSLDTTSLRNVLALKTTISKEHTQLGLAKAVNIYLEKWIPVLERSLPESGFEYVDGNLLAKFIDNSEEIDLDKWLGLVCKCDTDTLVPQGGGAIVAIIGRAKNFHRRLPGWIVRTFSRLTRRFAEDKVLSQTTDQALRDLGVTWS